MEGRPWTPAYVVMDTSEQLTGEDVRTYSYTQAVVVVIGLPLVVLALYKIYVDHKHNREKAQAHREKMEEYRKAKSGFVATLHNELISTRMDKEDQRMRLEDNEQALRDRYQKEMSEQETRHLERERELEARIRGIKKQTLVQLEKEKQKNHQRIKQLEEEVSSQRNEIEALESTIEKQEQSLKQQGERYAELNDKHSTYFCQSYQRETDLKNEKEELEKLLSDKTREMLELEMMLGDKKAAKVKSEKQLLPEKKAEKEQLEKQLEKRKEEPKEQGVSS